MAFSLGRLLILEECQYVTKLGREALKHRRTFGDFTRLGKQKLEFWYGEAFRTWLTKISAMNEFHRNETILTLSHYLIKLHRKRCQKTQQKVCEKKANMTEELCRVFSKPTVLGRPKSNFKSSKETWHWQILQALTETSGGIYISVEANQR